MAVYVVGRNGKIVFWNDGAERITGYLRQDVLGRIYEANFWRELDGIESEEGGKDGTLVWVHHGRFTSWPRNRRSGASGPIR